MALQTDQYDEEISLIVECGLKGSPNVELREDRPSYKLWLTELREAKAKLTAQLDSMTMRERTLLAELLPDDERKRLAQLARDFRDDTMPDIDAHLPMTPCPPWCERTDHDGEARMTHHEGAITSFHADGFEGERFQVCTFLAEDGQRALISFDGQGCFGIDDASRLITGVEAAKQLAVQIEAAR